MATIELPKILNIPTKLLALITEFDKYDYFVIEGGRGGGKSQSIGRFFLYLAERYNIRMVCGREVQNSIKESVYTLIAELIRDFNLNCNVLAKEIQHRESNSTITFRGFREQGSFNIQGMEGVDVLWIDEAQAITKQTLDVLIPTVRKDHSKVIFTMNRHVHNDPVYSTFVGRADCLHIKINFDENPFCTEKLKKEAAECLKKSPEDYKHIWLGEPLSKSEDQVFGHDELMSAKSAIYPPRQGYGTVLAGYDIARYGDDKCAVVAITQTGALHWSVSYVDQWGHTDLNTTTGRILTTDLNLNSTKSIIDEDGIGAGPLDTLNKGRGLTHFIGFRNPVINYTEDKFYANKRTANVYKLKELILKGHIHIEDEALLEELETLRYSFDHNQRRILVSKDKMRKEGYKSPNLADALIMAVSLINDIKIAQDNQYRPRTHQSAPDCNLFESAGIR